MKITNRKHLKEMLTEHFKVKILESLGFEGVNRARRSDNAEGDYEDEAEGSGVSYDESINRSRRGEDKPHDYPEENEGLGTTYEHLKFNKELFETNLYSDADKEVSETNLYSDADKEGADETERKGKGHAVPSDVKNDLSEPSDGMSEGKFPSLKSVFFEGSSLGLAEVSPPGWEKTVKKMKKEKDITNPWSLAWYMHNKGAKPDGKKNNRAGRLKWLRQ